MTGAPERLAIALADRYRIERGLGQGGMATVYLARDLKHDRDVAIKVLKPELAAVLGAERFVVEIKTTAALQHPHILPLFDSGEADGFLYYVMPFIDGETLRAKLDRETQLGVDEALRITTEVAGALHYAHEHGVIHRDIKPENILLQDGRSMVADFGIALAVSAAAGGRMTETGLSLGTPHYMSPEQATAEKEITARSDQYSLASVLYEMLTGNPPHTGASAQQIIMKIITEPATDVTSLRKSVPPAVADAVAQALEKLPADRFVSTQAFAQALRDPAGGGARTRGTAAAREVRGPSRVVVGLGGVLAGAALVAAAMMVTGRSWLSAEQPVSRFAVSFAGSDGYGAPMPSPDGSLYAYAGGMRDLLVRDRNALVPRTMAKEAWNPFFSPAGDALGYATGFPGALKTVSLSTGSIATVVADSAFGFGGAWSDDGWLYYVGGAASSTQVRRVRAGGGVPEVVAQLDQAREELFFYWPQALPGGKHLLVTMYPVRGEGVVMAVELASGQKTVLTPGLRAIYSPSGHLLVLRSDGTLAGATFDPERAALTGPLVPLVEDVAVRIEAETFFVSGDGTLTYQPAIPPGQVVRVTRDGVEQPVDAEWRAAFRSVSVSPDGTRLAIALAGGGRVELCGKALPAGPLSRLSYDGILNYRPAWHDGGRSILFASDRSGAPQLYSVPADGSGPAVLVRSAPQAIDEGELSADGRWLTYRTGSGGNRDVFVVGTGSDTTPIPVATTEYEEYAPAFSPDARALVYVSTESGRPEVYIRPLATTASGRVQVSVGGGEEPSWSHDGREIFYRNSSGELTSAQVATDAGFRITARHTLFSMQSYATEFRSRLISVAPDDQSFYLVREAAAERNASEVIVVQHWFQELEARVKAGK